MNPCQVWFALTVSGKSEVGGATSAQAGDMAAYGDDAERHVLLPQSVGGQWDAPW
jgi:hypothetical protein